MSNIPEDMFRKPKPMIQPVRLQNVAGQPTMPTHIQQGVSQRHPSPLTSIVPNQRQHPRQQVQQARVPSRQPRVETRTPENVAEQNDPRKSAESNIIPRMIHRVQHNEEQKDGENNVLSIPQIRQHRPNIPSVPRPSNAPQAILSRLNHTNHPLRSVVQTPSQSGLLASYSIKGSTGIQIPVEATKLIVNAVAGGGAGGQNTETSGGGGGGAGAGVNGLIIPLHSLTQGTIKIDVGQGGNVSGANGPDGGATVIVATSPISNFSLTLNGGKAGSGTSGGTSGNVQFFSKASLAASFNGGDCNYKNYYSSGAAGGAGSTPGNKGSDGGSSLFQGGVGNATTGAGGGGASSFANGGSGHGRFGSGGEGGHNGGDGFVTLEFYA